MGTPLPDETQQCSPQAAPCVKSALSSLTPHPARGWPSLVRTRGGFLRVTPMKSWGPQDCNPSELLSRLSALSPQHFVQVPATFLPTRVSSRLGSR